MRCKAHRFALSAALCCCSLLLAVSIAAPAGAGSSASLPTWVQVFTWSGGGEGNDIRNSAPFTLQGGQQIFRSSAAAVPGEYSSPSSGWTVESADSGSEFEMIETPGMGESESRLYLPAGSYFVGSNTLDCTWTVVISEMRPAPPGPPTVIGFTPASGPRGTGVTLTGSGLTGATAVAFNGTAAATFSEVSDTQITATVPAAATTGTIGVTTPGGTGTSATSFTVTVLPVTPTVTLKLSGLKSGAVKLGKSLTAKGKVTPSSLAGSKVKLTVQKKKGTKWVTLKSVTRTISLTCAYSWKYKPAKKGAYHMRATIAKTALHTAAKTKWRPFKVE